MSLIASAILFVILAVNVGIGSSGGKVFLGDVGEMLVLFASAIFFVVAILQREAARKNKNGGA
jgi:hypothetical protein